MLLLVQMPMSIHAFIKHCFFMPLYVVFIFYTLSAQASSSSCADIFAQTVSRYDFNSPPKTKKLQFKNPPILRLTNYNMHNGTLNQGTVSERRFNGESFDHVDSYLSMLGNAGRNGEMLGDQQDFSLNKMVETGYISSQEAEYFRNLGLKLNSNQVYFWEVYREATYEEVSQNYQDFRFRSISAGVNLSDYSLWPAKTAAMWNVAGQVWDYGKIYTPLKLPWEFEEARKDFSLDREKYKFVFEWGRAAQDLAGDIEHIYAANTLLSLVQVLAYKGSIDDAYVMVHSFDKVNTRLYSRMHPDTMYPPGWKNLDDALFLVPLREALKKYPIARASERVRKIIELSNGKLTPVQAVELIISGVLHRKSEMHFISSAGEQRSPVILTDSSAWLAFATHGAARSYGLTPEEAQAIYEYFTNQSPPGASYNYLEKYQNAADSTLSRYEYAARNAIEISNLDPVLAQNDPFFVIRALFSTLHHKMATLAQMIQTIDGRSSQAAYDEAANILRTHKIEIGITTHSPVILQQIRDLQPVASVPLLGTIVEGSVPQNLIDSQPYLFRDAEMNFFSVEQIMAWGIENPWMFRSLRGNLHYGSWTSQYLMSLPDSL